jgi:hypothetical protein
MEVYTIKSAKTGKYLTSLFSDKHSDTFKAKEFKSGTCYYYNIKQIAEDIAKQLNGVVETITLNIK